MPDTTYQRSIDQAARTLAAANADYQRIYEAMNAVPAEDQQQGGTGYARYVDLSKQLDAAAKRSNDAEKAYQDSIELADSAAAKAKDIAPAGEPRDRLDMAGNTIVAVHEVADGRGGWTVDPTKPPSKVDIPGVTTKDSVTAAPSSEYILRDGKLEKNAAYKPPQPTPGSAVPTSQFVYGPDGKPVANEAYTKPSVEINTTSEWINDPDHPGQLMKNKNYKKPGDLFTPGQTAVDTATASTAADQAQATLTKAQADAAKAQVDLTRAQQDLANAPTSAEAQRAKDTAQRTLELAQEQQQEALNQLRKVNPTLAQQAEANLTLTQQNIEKNKLGDLYGMQDRIKQVRDLIALGKDHGGIDPGDGESMLTAMSRGTTVFQAQQQAQADRNTARTTTGTNLNQLAGTFGSMANSGLGTLADMNKYAAVGSTAGADAFVALLNMAQDRLKQYQLPPASQTDYLGPGSPVSAMVNAAIASGGRGIEGGAPQGNPVAANPAQPITINIGSGAASTPQPQTPSLPAGVAGTPGDPRNMAVNGYQGAPNPNVFGSGAGNVGGLVSAAAKGVPASEDDIYSAYGVPRRTI